MSGPLLPSWSFGPILCHFVSLRENTFQLSKFFLSVSWVNNLQGLTFPVSFLSNFSCEFSNFVESHSFYFFPFSFHSLVLEWGESSLISTFAIRTSTWIILTSTHWPLRYWLTCLCRPTAGGSWVPFSVDYRHFSSVVGMDLNGTFSLQGRILSNEDCDKLRPPPSTQCVGVCGTRESWWVVWRLMGTEG